MLVEAYRERMEAGFVKPNGGLVNVPLGQIHNNFAKKKLQKKGKAWKGKQYWTAADKYMMLTGNTVRYSIGDDEVDISIIDTITNAQLSVIKKMAKSRVTFIYDIVNDESRIVDSGNGFNKFMKAIKRYDILERKIRESSIDFPQEDLDPDVWTKEGQKYVLRPDVKKKILNTLSKYDEVPLIKIADELRVVGSITSNQYTPDVDIDVHLTLSPGFPNKSSEFQRDVMRWFNTHRDDVNGWVNKHPIEVYIQLNPAQDMMSVGVYDLNTGEWKKGPKLVDKDYDPYEDFADVFDQLRDMVKDADELLGELKRDVIDYDVISQAMMRLSDEDRKRFRDKLQQKLQEMEQDIESLYDVRGEWVQLRKQSSAPATSEEALQDIDLAKRWKNANALFKFISRYKYIKIIGELNKMLEDENIDSTEVEVIKDLVGV